MITGVLPVGDGVINPKTPPHTTRSLSRTTGHVQSFLWHSFRKSRIHRSPACSFSTTLGRDD